MNEPACFNPNEGTFPKNNLHNLGNETIEHRLVHNIYGLFNAKSTCAGMQERTLGEERVF